MEPSSFTIHDTQEESSQSLLEKSCYTTSRSRKIPTLLRDGRIRFLILQLALISLYTTTFIIFIKNADSGPVVFSSVYCKTLHALFLVSGIR